MIFLVALFSAISTFFIALLVIVYLRNTYSLDVFHRLRRHYSEDTSAKGGEAQGLIVKLYGVVQRIAKPFVKFNFSQLVETKMKQAGVPLLGAEFIVIELIAAGAAGLGTYLLTLDERIALVGMAIAPVLLWAVILIRIDNRRESFTEQLSDCLTTVSNALRAGYSFQQSMEVIAKEMEPPISEEFARVTTDISMGINLEDALEQMARRVNSSDFDLVVTAVLIQREVGGNLAQVLDSISDTINERIRMKREIRALTAQGRLSAIILLLLPFVVGAGMYFLNHDNFMILFEDEMGQMAMVVAIIMEIIGVFVIKKIIEIDV